MGRYEVTQSQWQAVMDNDKSRYKGANLPVQDVSWNDAQKFIDKMNQKGDGFHYRLPSEAEWEYACRAGTSTDYSFGDYSRGSPATAAQANFNGMHMGDQQDMAKANAERPTPVGSFAPNAFGLYDMHGNMWEWCEDRFHPNYEGAPTDGGAWLSGGGGRVLRGGSYDSDAISMFSAYRSGSTPDVDSHYYGLRVVAIARTQ
jgi:formylglycine-generating enzyme required for sulfatase activity